MNKCLLGCQDVCTQHSKDEPTYIPFYLDFMITRANALSSSSVELVEKKRIAKALQQNGYPLVLYTSTHARAGGRKGMTKDLGQP